MKCRVIASDFRHMLSKRLGEAGIVIAFPQQDVHLDTGKPIQVSLVPDTELPVQGKSDVEEPPTT